MDEPQGIRSLLDALVHADRRLSVLLSTDDLGELLREGILRTAPAGARIAGPGGNSRSVFLILQGQLREEGDRSAEESVLGPGDLIGTAGILGADSDTVPAVVETPAILVQIPQEIAGRVFERLPRLIQRLFERYRARIIERTLAHAPLLSVLGAEALAELAARATLAGHREGSEVVRSGEPGDTFYILADGLAAVCHELEGRPVNLALVRPGDYFGEWSLLTGAPRAATVAALTRTITVGIDRETFLDLVQRNPSIQQRVDLEAHQRYERSVEFRARVESNEDVREKLDAVEAIIAERL